MKKMKKAFCFVLIAMLVVSSLFAGGSTEKPSTSIQTVFAGGWPYSTVPTGHFNMFVSNAIELKFFREIHQLPLATYESATASFQPMLATSWEISEDGSELVVELRDDVKWLSGDVFTAKDVWTTFMMYRLVGNPVWNYIDDVQITADDRIVFSISNPTVMLLRYVLRKPMVDYMTYGEFADKVQALLDDGKDENSSEWKTIITDFNAFRPNYVNATGPYYLDPAKVSQSSIDMPKNPNSFLADTVKFDKVVVYNGDVPDLTPLVLNGQVDYLTHQFPASSMTAFENVGYKTLQLAGVDGIALYFNHNVKPLNQLEVRQAIAYVIDRDRIGQLALPGVTRGTKYISGLGDGMTESWVDTSLLTDYNVDIQKATELLMKAGLTKKDGQWYLADGKPFHLSLQCPTSWSDAATAASEVAQQLTAFGIKTTFNGIEATQRQTNINEGAFELALSFFGTGQPHPMFAYETPLLVSNVKASRGLGYPMVQTTEKVGTVNMEELIYASTNGWDTDEQKKIVEKIVLTFNETLPILPLYTKYTKNVTSEGLRTVWDGDPALYQNSPGDDNFAIIMLLNGDLYPIIK